LNNTNSFGYDAYGRKIWERDPLGRTNWFGYCGCGTLSSVTNAIGQWALFQYDNVGQLLATVAHDGFTVTKSYDPLGRVVSASDSSGATMTNTYNHQGLLVTVSNVLGRVSLAEFDLWDRATNVVDLNGLSARTTYDVLGRTLVQTAADGSTNCFGYTAGVAGATSQTNQLDDVTRFAYDIAGRLFATTNALNQVTLSSYGVSGELLSLTDPKTNITRWGYDQLARMSYKTNATGSRVLALSYDVASRVTNSWTPAKGNIVYGYDTVGRLTNIAYATSGSIQMAYDALNRLTNRVDAVGTTKFTYNTTGLPDSEDGPWAEDTISYSYSQRRLTGASLLQPGASAWTVSYGYDAAQRLTNLTSAAGAFGYQYESSRPGLESRVNLPGGTYIDYAHDFMARLTNTSCRAAGGLVLDAHDYAYNLASQMTRHTRTEGSYVDYTYDQLGQLRSATGKESGGVTNRLQEQMNYGYDAAGNLQARTNNGFIQNFGVNARNELSAITRSGTFTVAGNTEGVATNVTVNALGAGLYADRTYASAGHTLLDGTNIFTAVARGTNWADTNSTTAFLPATVNYTYDANGNLTSDGRQGYDYDDANQLMRITVTNQWKSEFVYDGAGRRRVRKEYTWSGAWTLSTETRYVYDGMLVMQERNASNQPQLTFTRGLDLSGTIDGAGGIGGLLARTDHTTGTALYVTAFFFSDGPGSVSSLVSTNGLVMAHYRYDAYGAVLAKYGPLADANRYQFSTKELHAASGLVYFGFRYYSPSLQRWLNQDPIQEAGGLNLYRYVGNAPSGVIDPFGEDDNPTQIIKRQDPSPLPTVTVYGNRWTWEGSVEQRQMREAMRNEINRAILGAIRSVSDQGGGMGQKAEEKRMENACQLPTPKSVAGFAIDQVNDTGVGLYKLGVNVIGEGAKTLAMAWSGSPESAQLSNFGDWVLGHSDNFQTSPMANWGWYDPGHPVTQGANMVVVVASFGRGGWSGLTRGGSSQLGALTREFPSGTTTVAQAIRARGGGGQQVQKLSTTVQQQTLIDVGNAAAGGNAAAKEAVKAIKQAGQKGERCH
jgi:RHS repeat-associated protein